MTYVLGKNNNRGGGHSGLGTPFLREIWGGQPKQGVVEACNTGEDRVQVQSSGQGFHTRVLKTASTKGTQLNFVSPRWKVSEHLGFQNMPWEKSTLAGKINWLGSYKSWSATVCKKKRSWKCWHDVQNHQQHMGPTRKMRNPWDFSGQKKDKVEET